MRQSPGARRRLLQYGSASNHATSRKTDETHPLGRNIPTHGMLPNHFGGLNPIGDSLFTGLVHVYVGNALLPFFNDPILEYERSNAVRGKPACNIIPCYISSQRDASSAWRDDHAGSSCRISFRKVDGQRRNYDVKDNGPDGRATNDSFFLSPLFGAGSGGARPDSYRRGCACAKAGP